MPAAGKLGRVSNNPKRKFLFLWMKTILVMSVAFLLLRGYGSLMERNTTASREYHDE
jgi:hypothetical protein